MAGGVAGAGVICAGVAGVAAGAGDGWGVAGVVPDILTLDEDRESDVLRPFLKHSTRLR